MSVMSVRGGELPLNGGAALVTFFLQGLHTLLQGRRVRHQPGEVAACEGTTLDLGLVQPAAV